ncbi:MAG: methylenetetrahydrofolate reductase C-terminal domain-containing protein [Arenicellales bacterium]
MYAIRRWSVRHARKLEWLYQRFEGVLLFLHPMWLWLGYDRIEKPIRVTEQFVKETMFDCKMCGNCVLSQTGMACPMNCPKELRNGPCGGVREHGYCEVKPDMRCVWVEAWEGSQRMRGSEKIQLVQPPVAQQYRGRSSWLREIRRKRDERFFSSEGSSDG